MIKYIPLKSIRQSENHPRRFRSLYRIEKVPHHNKEFCDPETSWQVDTGFDNKSMNIYIYEA